MLSVLELTESLGAGIFLLPGKLAAVAGPFSILVFASVLESIFQYIPTCLTVIILRRKRPDILKRYTVPGGYVIPYLALITCFRILLQVKLIIIIAILGGISLSLPIYYSRKTKV